MRLIQANELLAIGGGARMNRASSECDTATFEETTTTEPVNSPVVAKEVNYHSGSSAYERWVNQQIRN